MPIRPKDMTHSWGLFSKAAQWPGKGCSSDTTGQGCPPPRWAWTAPGEGAGSGRRSPERLSPSARLVNKSFAQMPRLQESGEESAREIPSFPVKSTHTGTNRKRRDSRGELWHGPDLPRNTKPTLCPAMDLPSSTSSNSQLLATQVGCLYGGMGPRGLGLRGGVKVPPFLKGEAMEKDTAAVPCAAASGLDLELC